MHPALNNISVAGIIKPGDIFIFSERLNRGWDPGPIEFLYFIAKEKEILEALEIEIAIYCDDTNEFIKLLEWWKISDDCYTFSLLCYDKEEQCEVKHLLHLHKIMTVEDKLRWLRETA